MTETLKAMVEAMIAEAKRQDGEETERSARMPWLADEAVSTEHAYNWNKVARAGLLAIPPHELAAAIGAALDPDDYYVFGTTEGVQPGEREDMTNAGIDGSGDLVSTSERLIRALVDGIIWKPGRDGVLVAHASEADPEQTAAPNC